MLHNTHNLWLTIENNTKRSGNTITAVTLLLIATNAIISTDRFPSADKIWDYLNNDKKDWDAWENLHKVAGHNSKVKNQAVGVQDQFGTAHGALKYSPPSAQKSNGPSRPADELGEYFDALAVDVTTEKGILEELVKANNSPPAPNPEFLDAVAVLI